MAVYRGEAARRPGEVHYGNQLLPIACGEEAKYLPRQDVVVLGSSRVTCARCLSVLAGGAR